MHAKALRVTESLILKGVPGSIFEQKSPLIPGNPHGLALGHVHCELVFNMRCWPFRTWWRRAAAAFNIAAFLRTDWPNTDTNEVHFLPCSCVLAAIYHTRSEARTAVYHGCLSVRCWGCTNEEFGDPHHLQPQSQGKQTFLHHESLQEIIFYSFPID